MPEESTGTPVVDTSSLCLGCGQVIKDQYIYRVLPDMQWHESCLKCSECDCLLNESLTCFVKNGRAYCKTDYYKLFATKCERCGLCLKKDDLIMKSKSKIYHVECFCCNVCGKKLLPGDEYQLRNELLVCKEDALVHLAQQHHMKSGQQLFLQSSNMAFTNSSMSLTPDNSLKSSSSSSNSSANFSPSNNSSLSSIVDSPTSAHFVSHNNSTSLTFNNPTNNFNNFNSIYYHTMDSISNSHSSLKAEPKDHKSYADYEYQDKEDDRCISDEEDNRNNSEDEEEDNDETSTTSPDDDESSIDTCKQANKSRQYKSGGKPVGNHQVDGSLLQINNYGPKQHYSSSNRSSKPARIRTVLNEKQLQTLRTFYNNNPRPDALIKEQLVEMTGLNSRVIRVWFQNKRCKDKKKSINGNGVTTGYPSQPAFPSHSNYSGEAFMNPATNVLQLPGKPTSSQQSIYFENCY